MSAIANRPITDKPVAKKPSWVWVRAGDGSEYEKFDDAYEAGYNLGSYFDGRARMPEVTKYGGYGVEVGTMFEGPHNYVSLFWGDKEAQPIKGCSASDLEEFTRGIAEGADIDYIPEIKVFDDIKVRRPTKKSPRQMSLDLDIGFSGMRRG